jgi:F-type H+-transporting ATPase subunit gamma
MLTRLQRYCTPAMNQ